MLFSSIPILVVSCRPEMGHIKVVDRRVFGEWCRVAIRGIGCQIEQSDRHVCGAPLEVVILDLLASLQ